MTPGTRFDDLAWPPPNPPIALADPPGEPVLLTVRVTLNHTDPEVWRRFTIPGELHLEHVHDALQQVMGWEESHLHRFSPGDDPYSGPYFVTEFDETGAGGTYETEARLDQVLRTPGDTLTYEYDFGDSWTHTLTLESTAPMPDPADAGASGPSEAGSAAYPLVCLAGERACPPEDVGGIGGYADMAAWVRSGYAAARMPELGLTAAELRQWLPAGWDPDHFDPDEASAMLARLAPRDTDTALEQLPPDVIRTITRLATPARFELDDWLAAPGWGEPVQFTSDEAAELTRPLRVLLDVVGDGLTLTAAGFLPPRVVETLFESLGLDDDDWVGKPGRESDTWPVLDLRQQVRRVGLVRKAKGRLLPTVVGRKLHGDPDALLAHVIGHLLAGLRDFDRAATLFMLVAVGGGQWSRHIALWGPVPEVVCRVLAIDGWQRESSGGFAGGFSGGLDRSDVSRGVRDAMGLLEAMVRAVGDPSREPELAGRLARAALAAVD